MNIIIVRIKNFLTKLFTFDFNAPEFFDGFNYNEIDEFLFDREGRW